MAQEVAPLGIKVKIIEQGSFRTDFNGRSFVTADNLISDCNELISSFREWLRDIDGKQPHDPIKWRKR